MKDIISLENKKVKDAFDVASIVMQILSQDSNNENDINVLQNKNKGAKHVTPTVRNFSLDSNSNKSFNYINVSTNSNIAGDATLILTVRNRSETSGLFPRQPGSTPGRGASACFKINKGIK